MTTTATKNTPASGPDVKHPSFFMTPEKFAEHEQNLAAIRARQEANRERMIECLDPFVAAEYERRKPRFEWEVSASWLAKNNEGQIVRKEGCERVIAQNENDAWSQFLAMLQENPSKHDAKPTFKKLRQLEPGQVTSTEGVVIKTERLTPPPKKRRL